MARQRKKQSRIMSERIVFLVYPEYFDALYRDVDEIRALQLASAGTDGKNVQRVGDILREAMRDGISKKLSAEEKRAAKTKE